MGPAGHHREPPQVLPETSVPKQVYRADPDGYTLLSSPPPPLVINHNFYSKLGFEPAKFEPIIVIAEVPNALIINPNNIKAANLSELARLSFKRTQTRSLPPRRATERPRI